MPEELHFIPNSPNDSEDNIRPDGRARVRDHRSYFRGWIPSCEKAGSRGEQLVIVCRNSVKS